MPSCVKDIAGSIGLNCEKPIEGGYTGRAVLIPIGTAGLVLTRHSQNPSILSNIAAHEAAKLVSADNVGMTTPFEGSNSTGNSDAGFTKFVKAFAMRIPQRGAQFAADVLEPLVKSGRGFIIVAEKVDTVGDGSFEVIGSGSPAKVVDPSTVTRDENANGGAWSLTLQSSEFYAECDLFDTDYATTLAKFEALLAACY